MKFLVSLSLSIPSSLSGGCIMVILVFRSEGSSMKNFIFLVFDRSSTERCQIDAILSYIPVSV